MKSSYLVYILPCVSLIILGFFASDVMSIKCFVCDNVNDGKACEHGEIENKYLKDCNDQAQMSNDSVALSEWKLCRKIVTWIDFEVGGKQPVERVLRRCGHVSVEKYDNDCYYRGGFGGRQKVCTCMVEGCNPAPTFTLSSALLLTTSAFLFAFKSFVF